MTAVFDDPAATGRLVTAGLARAAQLSWAATAAGYLEVFTEAAGPPVSPGDPEAKRADLD